MSSCNINNKDVNNFDLQEVQRSIIKKYRSKLWTPFIKGVKEYNMINDGDHIAVCISGGKDSLVLAKLLQEMQAHTNTNFKLSFISMDPGFNQENKDLLLDTCNKLGIDVDIFETEIFDIVEKIAKDYPCFMCAKMRRGALYSYAEKIGANKKALGHH
ncbi:MAG: hypothetical protein ACK5HS_01200 [Mycoplasmatales bacterium]